MANITTLSTTCTYMSALDNSDNPMQNNMHGSSCNVR